MTKHGRSFALQGHAIKKVPGFLGTDWQKVLGDQGVTGATGSAGAQGEKGITGATGATKVLFRGQWSVDEIYEQADIVKYDEKLFQLLCRTGFACSTAPPKSN